MSYHFLADFIRRTQILEVRNGRVLDTGRRFAEVEIADFFERHRDILSSIQPYQLLNLDEAGCRSNGNGVKVICARGFEVPHMAGTETQKPHVTVGPLINGAGQMLHTFIITASSSDGDVIPHVGDDLEQFTWCGTESGFITEEVWPDVMINRMIPAIVRSRQEHGDDTAMYLLLDGHQAHYSARTLAVMEANNVVAVFMPPKTSHLLQPLDRAFFGALKSRLRAAMAQVQLFQSLNLAQRLGIIKRVLLDIAATDGGSVVAAGFKHAGFIPFDPLRPSRTFFNNEFVSPRVVVDSTGDVQSVALEHENIVPIDTLRDRIVLSTKETVTMTPKGSQRTCRVEGYSGSHAWIEFGA